MIDDAGSTPFDHDEFVLTVRHGLLSSNVSSHNADGGFICRVFRPRMWLIHIGYWAGSVALLLGWISGAIALFMWYGNQYGQSGWFSIVCLIALLAGPVILILLIKRFEPESTVTILTEDDQHPRFALSSMRIVKAKSRLSYGAQFNLVDRDGIVVGSVARSGRDGMNYSFWKEAAQSDRVDFHPARRTRKRDLVAAGFLGLGVLGRLMASNYAIGGWTVVRSRNNKHLGSLTALPSDRSRHVLELSHDPSGGVDRRLALLTAMLILVTPSNER